jgi:hypothetical protein
MSNVRFASMTSALLARKGQAAPSQPFPPPPDSYWRPVARVNGDSVPASASALATVREEPTHEESEETPLVVTAKLMTDDRPHKVRVSLSNGEFERFGLAAVKRGIARHQLIREAINDYVDRLMRDYENCGCITGAPTTACCRG